MRNAALPSDKYSAPVWALDDVWELTSIRGQAHRRRFEVGSFGTNPCGSDAGQTFLVPRWDPGR